MLVTILIYQVTIIFMQGGMYTPESGIVVLKIWLVDTLVPAGLTADTLHIYSSQPSSSPTFTVMEVLVVVYLLNLPVNVLVTVTVWFSSTPSGAHGGDQLNTSTPSDTDSDDRSPGSEGGPACMKMF